MKPALRRAGVLAIELLGALLFGFGTLLAWPGEHLRTAGHALGRMADQMGRAA